MLAAPAQTFGTARRCGVLVRIPLRAALALLFAVVAFAAPSFAQSDNWLGTAGTTGNWSDATKWSTGTVANGSTDISIAAGTVNGNYNVNSSSPIQLTIAAPATLNILSSTSLSFGEGVIDNSGVMNNSGTITAYALYTEVGSTTNNSGTIIAPEKVLSNDGTLNNSGSMTVIGFESTGSINNTGTINFDDTAFGGSSGNSGSLTNQAKGTIVVTGYLSNFVGGTLTNLGTITDIGGTNNQGTFNNAGIYTVTATGAGNNYGVLNNTGQFNIAAGGYYLSFGSIVNAAGAQINNAGQFESDKEETISNLGTVTNNGAWLNGSVFVNSGVVNNQGSFQNGESTVKITSGGVLNNSNVLKNTDGAVFTVANGGTLNNSGVFSVDATSTFTMAAGSKVINSATGQMFLSSPTLQVVAAGNLLNNGTITMVGSTSGGIGGLILPPPTLVIASTGTFAGTGFVVGNVTNYGIVAPGNSTGTMTIDGNFQQMAGSTLDILLGGAGAGEFSQLDVNGDALLGGTLDVSMLGSFDPESGEIFEILSGKISGAFAAVDLPTLDDGLYFVLDQEANGVFIDVDGTKTSGGGGSTGTMPEPGSLLLLVAGLALLFLMKHGRAGVASATASRAASPLSAAPIVLLALLAFASAASAQSTTWNDAPSNGVWNQAGNWSNGVPASTTYVQIGSNTQMFPPIVTLGVNSTVNSLNILGEGTTLTLTGESLIDATTPVNLTVTGPMEINSPHATVNVGAGASLTMNGFASNQGTINLTTTTIIAGEAPYSAQLNGSGTLSNSGTIQGAGIISTNILNSSTGELSGNLTLNGITVVGGGYFEGQLDAINATFSGVTLGGTTTSPPGMNPVTLVGGSTVTAQNTLTNMGSLTLGSGTRGATINGSGEIVNEGTISGGGTISVNIENLKGSIIGASSTPLVLQGNVSGDVTQSFIAGSLVLDGAHVSGNTIAGGATLTAQNGATFQNGLIAGGANVTLSAGSVLDVSGTQMNGVLKLDNSTITGAGTLQNNGIINGSGTIAVNLNNSSAGELNGNFTFNGARVSGGNVVGGAVTSANATFSNVTMTDATLTGGSNLIVESITANNLNIGSAGAGATISAAPGGGEIINNGLIAGGGTISAGIVNTGNNGGMSTVAATNTAVPLVLKGNISNESSNVSQSVLAIDTNASMILDGATVSDSTINGSGGTLGAKNGASLVSSVIDATVAPLTLAGGSTLGISSVTVNGTFQLGDASEGANLNSAFVGAVHGLELAQNSVVQGGGTINAQIESLGGGNGSIIANNPAAALVLAGNVSNVESVVATNGATLTLANVNVGAVAAMVEAGGTFNGSGTIVGAVLNAGTIAPTGAGGSALYAINGLYRQADGGALDFTLGGGANQIIVENDLVNGSIATFDPGSVFEASLLAGFDPSTGCSTVFGVCESFTVFETEGGAGDTFSGFSNIAFELPTLPAGFQWLTLDENNDAIVLEIEGMKSTSGGGGNGTMPEPSEWMMLASGLLALLAFTSLARRRKGSAVGVATELL
jgi:fibronectin-binding autotransporter adhesin